MSPAGPGGDALLVAIGGIAADAPDGPFARLLAVLDAQPRAEAADLRWEVEQAIPGAHLRRSVGGLLDAWARTDGLTAGAVALALRAARLATERSAAGIDLVWTGPATAAVPVRRTDQVLLSMIEGCRRELLVVSFAVHEGERWTAALRAAVERGVQATFVVETAASGKVTADGLLALDPALRSHLRVLTWDVGRRPHDGQGRTGALHAKVAVADRRVALISSANLTEHAMTLNLELGVTVSGGELPARIARVFDELQANGELTEPRR